MFWINIIVSCTHHLLSMTSISILIETPVFWYNINSTCAQTNEIALILTQNGIHGVQCEVIWRQKLGEFGFWNENKKFASHKTSIQPLQSLLYSKGRMWTMVLCGNGWVSRNWGRSLDNNGANAFVTKSYQEHFQVASVQMHE